MTNPSPYTERFRTNSSAEDRQIEYILDHDESNPILYAMYVVDTIRESSWAHYRQSGDIDAEPDFTGAIDTAKTLVEQAMRKESRSLFMYFRAKFQVAMIDTLFYGPIAYQDMSVQSELRKKINDTNPYFQTAAILDEAIEMYDSLGALHPQRRELVGIINELTMVNLLNRTRQPDGPLALPANLIDDNTNKTDVDWFDFDDKNHGRRLPIQVKSSLYKVNDASAKPVNGILITAHDFMNNSEGNIPPLTISRLIIEEFKATSVRTETSQVLDEVERMLIDIVEERRP